MAYFTYLWSGVFLGGEITIMTHWSIRFRLGGFFRRSVLAWSPKSWGDLKLVERPWCALQAGKLDGIKMVGGNCGCWHPPGRFFFSLPPIFWRLLFELYMYNLHWTLLVKPLGFLVGFFFYGLIRHTISFRSWQGSASDWRQAVGNIHNGNPRARRLELTKKPPRKKRGAVEPTKIGVGSIRCPERTSISGSSHPFFRGVLSLLFLFIP